MPAPTAAMPDAPTSVLSALCDTVCKRLTPSDPSPPGTPHQGGSPGLRLDHGGALALARQAFHAALPLVARTDHNTAVAVVPEAELSAAQQTGWLAPLLEVLGDHDAPALNTLADALVAGAAAEPPAGGLDAAALCDRAVVELAVVAAEYPQLVHWWRTGSLERPDLEQAILGEVHGILGIDNEWTVALERGFGWVGHRMFQHVFVRPRIWSRGVSGVLLTSGTCVVRDVAASTEAVESVLADLNTHAVGSGWFFDREDRSLWLGCCHFVHPGSFAFRVRAHAGYTILQLEEAERLADGLAERLGGRVAERDHPMLPARTVPDEMLGVVEQVYQPAGRAPSAFARAEEFQALAEEIPRSVAATLGGSAGGITFEVPFGESGKALVRLMTDAPHPVLGAGLAVGTLFDVGGSAPELATMAQRMQQRQGTSTKAGGAYGGWGVKVLGERAFLGFFRFVPNWSYRAGVIRDVALGELTRAKWLDADLHPGLPRQRIRPDPSPGGGSIAR